MRSAPPSRSARGMSTSSISHALHCPCSNSDVAEAGSLGARALVVTARALEDLVERRHGDRRAREHHLGEEHAAPAALDATLLDPRLPHALVRGAAEIDREVAEVPCPLH